LFEVFVSVFRPWPCTTTIAFELCPNNRPIEMLPYIIQAYSGIEKTVVACSTREARGTMGMRQTKSIALCFFCVLTCTLRETSGYEVDMLTWLSLFHDLVLMKSHDLFFGQTLLRRLFSIPESCGIPVDDSNQTQWSVRNNFLWRKTKTNCS